MGIFGKKLNSAKTGGGGGVFFKPLQTSKNPPEYGTGKYRVKVELMKEFESREQKKYFVCETVIQSSNVPELPAGTRCSYMININIDAAPGNVKSLLCAVNGLDPNGSKDAAEIENQDWDKVYNTAISESNPTQGLEFQVECFYRRKKDRKPAPGTDKALSNDYYSHHVFYPAVEEKQAAE